MVRLFVATSWAQPTGQLRRATRHASQRPPHSVARLPRHLTVARITKTDLHERQRTAPENYCYPLRSQRVTASSQRFIAGKSAPLNEAAPIGVDLVRNGGPVAKMSDVPNDRSASSKCSSSRSIRSRSSTSPVSAP